MRSFLASAAAVAGLLLTAQAALAAAPYPGAQLNGTMTTEVNSKNAYVGQAVMLNNVTSATGSGHIVGARLYGTVTEVVKAGQGRPGKVSMTFTRLRLSNGTTYAVSGSVVGMQVNTKNNALKEAAGALGGMLVGNMIGKTIFHTGAGGFLGAAGGFMVAKNNRQDVTIPQGSVVGVRLNVVRQQPYHS